MYFLLYSSSPSSLRVVNSLDEPYTLVSPHYYQGLCYPGDPAQEETTKTGKSIACVPMWPTAFSSCHANACSNKIRNSTTW